MADTKRLLILTRDRANVTFRQRIEPYLPPLAARGIATEVTELADSAWARRRQFRAASLFDGVLLHRKTLTCWDALALDGAARRVIYDFDDAVMFQARSPDTPHPGRLRRFRRTMKRTHLAIAGSPVLADHARSAGAARVEIVPTGLDIRRFAPKADYGASGPLRLVWIGSRSTLKQLEPLKPALAAIGRAIPQATLRIVADARLDVEGLRVEFVPWSLDAEGRLLAEADIAIAPLPDTPFTRGKCGFKIVQYMAAGLPVVTSPVGVNADYVRPEESGLWATSVDEWTAAVRRLATDAALRERMGRAGRRRAEAEFDFAALATRVTGLIAETLA